MASEITTSAVDDLSGVAIQECRMTMQNLSQLSNYITKKDCPPGASTVRFPLLAGLTAAALTEGNDVANSAATTSSIEVSPTTNAVWGSVVTDIAIHDSGEDLFAKLGQAAGMAIIQKQNADIFALFDGFTGNTPVGSTTVDITEAAILRAKTMLLQRSVNPLEPIYMVITPVVLEDLLALYSTNTNITSLLLRDDALAGKAPPIYGVNVIIHTSGITETGDIKCGMFTRDALCMGVSWDSKIEVTRRSRAVAWDFVASSCYAVAELNDLHGVEMLLDGSD